MVFPVRLGSFFADMDRTIEDYMTGSARWIRQMTCDLLYKKAVQPFGRAWEYVLPLSDSLKSKYQQPASSCGASGPLVIEGSWSDSVHIVCNVELRMRNVP